MQLVVQTQRTPVRHGISSCHPENRMDFEKTTAPKTSRRSYLGLSQGLFRTLANWIGRRIEDLWQPSQHLARLPRDDDCLGMSKRRVARFSRSPDDRDASPLETNKGDESLAAAGKEDLARVAPMIRAESNCRLRGPRRAVRPQFWLRKMLRLLCKRRLTVPWRVDCRSSSRMRCVLTGESSWLCPARHNAGNESYSGEVVTGWPPLSCKALCSLAVIWVHASAQHRFPHCGRY